MQWVIWCRFEAPSLRGRNLRNDRGGAAISHDPLPDCLQSVAVAGHTTAAPRVTASRAVASPFPLEPPVMTIVCFLSGLSRGAMSTSC